MGTFIAILLLTTAMAGLVKVLSERITLLKHWGWPLGVLIQVIGVLVACFGFWPTDKPATPADVDTIITIKLDSLGNEMSCKMDSLSALIRSLSGQTEPDSTLLAQAREQAECLEGIVQTALDKGIVAIGLERYDEALTLLALALTASGENVKQRYEVFFYMGVIRSHQGEYTYALDCYDSCTTYDPTSHASWYNRGWALARLKRYDEAIASFDSALIHKPDKREAWINRGWALDRLGRHDEAIASYDSALLYKPDKHAAWYNRGWELDELERYDEAIASYDSALAYKPDKAEAWQNRAVSLAHLNRFDEALSSCDSALKYAPGDSLTIAAKQWIMELMNE